MDDDKIKQLFSEFNPPLSGSLQFMSQLKRGMDSVELVRQHNLEISRRNRKALAIALAVGFICGFLFSLFLPSIAEAMKNLQSAAPAGSLLTTVAQNYFPISLTIIAAATIFISLNAYELSLFLLKRRN